MNLDFISSLEERILPYILPIFFCSLIPIVITLFFVLRRNKSNSNTSSLAWSILISGWLMAGLYYSVSYVTEQFCGTTCSGDLSPSVITITTLLLVAIWTVIGIIAIKDARIKSQLTLDPTNANIIKNSTNHLTWLSVIKLILIVLEILGGIIIAGIFILSVIFAIYGIIFAGILFVDAFLIANLKKIAFQIYIWATRVLVGAWAIYMIMAGALNPNATTYLGWYIIIPILWIMLSILVAISEIVKNKLANVTTLESSHLQIPPENSGPPNL